MNFDSIVCCTLSKFFQLDIFPAKPEKIGFVMRFQVTQGLRRVAGWRKRGEGFELFSFVCSIELIGIISSAFLTDSEGINKEVNAKMYKLPSNSLPCGRK